MLTRARWRRIHATHIERLNADLDARLLARRAERDALARRSRKGASTRIHRAYVNDVLRNEMVQL